MKINIAGFNTKKSKIDLDFDVNTTAEVGQVQPVLCEEVIPQATYDMDCNSMIQVAPLLSPLFGRISLRQFTSFVPMSDIFHHFDEVIGSRKVTHGSTTNLVTSVPTISYKNLMKFLLHQQSVVSIWYFPLHDKAIPDQFLRDAIDDLVWTPGASPADVIQCRPTNQWNVPSYSSITDNNIIFLQNGASSSDGQSYNFAYIPYGTGAVSPSNVYYDVNPFYVQAYGTMPTLNDADYVIYRDITVGGNTYNIATCIRLSQRGRAFAKIINGLGLKINMDVLVGKYSDLADTQISLLPFFAYYKAWFDQMYPKRTINFANTNCGKIVSYLDSNSYSGDFLVSGGTYSTRFGLLDPFFNDLTTMSYVFENDYYTAHLSTLGTSTENVSLDTNDGLFNQGVQNSTLPAYLNTSLYSGSQSLITTAGLKLLAAINNAGLSGTFIGKRVNDYLRQYGVIKDDEESNFISSNILDIQTGSVLATNENENIFLGQKGGQAEGRSTGKNKSDNWKFTPKEHGFIVKFIAIVPKSRFSQGISPIFGHKTRYDFYNQQYDGVGYRLTPGYEFYAENPVGFKHASYANTYLNAIGYIGRYSEYKYKMNLANGDFIRRATKKSIGSYYLDKRLPESDIYYVDTPYSDALYPNSKVYRAIVSPSNPPMPTEAVRFCRNDYFDYNRIFVNRDEIENTKYLKRFFEPVDDHFIIHQINDFKAFAPVLPISDSMGTTDFIDENKNDIAKVEMS